MDDNPTIFVIGPPGAERQSLVESLAATRLAHAEFAKASDFLEATSESDRGCVIASLRLFGVAGLDLQMQLKHYRKTLPLILVSNQLSTRMVVRVMQEGAQTVLESPVEKEDLYFAVRKALQENERRVEMERQRVALASKFAAISTGEQEVLEHLCEGLSNRDIAKTLRVHVRTVEARKQRLLKKAGCKTVPKLLLSYQRYRTMNPRSAGIGIVNQQDMTTFGPHITETSAVGIPMENEGSFQGIAPATNWSEPQR